MNVFKREEEDEEVFGCVNTRWTKCGRGHMQLSSDGMNRLTAAFCLPVCICQESRRGLVMPLL